MARGEARKKKIVMSITEDLSTRLLNLSFDITANNLLLLSILLNLYIMIRQEYYQSIQFQKNCESRPLIRKEKKLHSNSLDVGRINYPWEKGRLLMRENAGIIIAEESGISNTPRWDNKNRINNLA